jgi:hypothetical protein
VLRLLRAGGGGNNIAFPRDLTSRPGLKNDEREMAYSGKPSFMKTRPLTQNLLWETHTLDMMSNGTKPNKTLCSSVFICVTVSMVAIWSSAVRVNIAVCFSRIQAMWRVTTSRAKVRLQTGCEGTGCLLLGTVFRGTMGQATFTFPLFQGEWQQAGRKRSEY